MGKSDGIQMLRSFVTTVEPSIAKELQLNEAVDDIENSASMVEELERKISKFKVEFTMHSPASNNARYQFLFHLIKLKNLLETDEEMPPPKQDKVHLTPIAYVKASPIFDSKLVGPSIYSYAPKVLDLTKTKRANNPICRICECEIEASEFMTHTQHCFNCHSMNLEFQSINEELVKQGIKDIPFTSKMGLYQSSKLLGNGNELVERRHKLMELGTESAEIALSSVVTKDAPNFVEGYGMTPIPPPKLKDFRVISPISRGAYGSVYLCQRKRTGDIFAMKALHNMQTKDLFRLEQEIMCRASHPSVISLYWSFRSSKSIYFVMSFARGGDLFSLLQSVGSLDEDVAIFYLRELISATHYLHTIKVIHADLKPDNVLINEKGHLQLTDFGLSKYNAEHSRSLMFRFAPNEKKNLKSTHENRLVGSPQYMAPESLINGYTSGEPIDFWAIGIIAFEMVCGYLPFDGDTQAEIFSSILCDSVQWPDDVEISDDYKSLIEHLLIKDPSQRADYEYIVNCPLFNGTDWTKIYDENPPFVPDLQNSLDLTYFENCKYTGSDCEAIDIDILDAETPDEWCCTNLGALADKNREMCINTAV